MWSDMKLDHGKVVKKTDKQTDTQRLANYNIDMFGLTNKQTDTKLCAYFCSFFLTHFPSSDLKYKHLYKNLVLQGMF